MSAAFDLAGVLRWLELAEHELLLFAAVFFALGALDELLVDLAWLRLRLAGKARDTPFTDNPAAPLSGLAAVLIPAWGEAEVIAAMLRHCRQSWPQTAVRFYAGCYRNDSATLAAMIAGVGCGFGREALARIATARGRGVDEVPFAAECLTEDYELGLLIAAQGGTSRFLRLRDGDGDLIATRELFPADLGVAVRQKTRWLHGIAFQGWDRMGWGVAGKPLRLAELWMRLRDRRGPLTAIVLAVAYLGIALWGVLAVAQWAGWHDPTPIGDGLRALLWLNLAGFAWRAGVRFGFTAQAYGWAEGLRALPRIPFANVIAIMAGRRALTAYLRSLAGGRVRWEKTPHLRHASELVSLRTVEVAR